MLETFKHLTKHSVIYGMGGFLNQFIAFLLLPVYTRYLTPLYFVFLESSVICGSLILLPPHLSYEQGE